MTEDTRDPISDAHRPPESFTIDGQTFTVHHGLSGPDAIVIALHADGRLGYLAAQQEWVDGQEPLPDEIQNAADQLVKAGLLPEFEEWFA